MGERDVVAWNLNSQGLGSPGHGGTTMQLVTDECKSKFPTIRFRKKRLAVAICTHFDMATAQDASAIKQMVEEAISRLTAEGHVKVSYTVVDL